MATKASQKKAAQAWEILNTQPQNTAQTKASTAWDILNLQPGTQNSPGSSTTLAALTRLANQSYNPLAGGGNKARNWYMEYQDVMKGLDQRLKRNGGQWTPDAAGPYAERLKKLRETSHYLANIDPSLRYELLTHLRKTDADLAAMQTDMQKLGNLRREIADWKSQGNSYDRMSSITDETMLYGIFSKPMVPVSSECIASGLDDIGAQANQSALDKLKKQEKFLGELAAQKQSDMLAMLNPFMASDFGMDINTRIASKTPSMEKLESLQREIAGRESLASLYDRMAPITEKTPSMEKLESLQREIAGRESLANLYDRMAPITEKTMLYGTSAKPTAAVGTGERLGVFQQDAKAKEAAQQMAVNEAMVASGFQPVFSLTGDQTKKAQAYAAGDKGYWNLLTDSEVNIYKHIRDEEGQKEADKWLDDMGSYILPRRYMEQTQAEMEAGGLRADFAYSIASIPMNMAGNIYNGVGDLVSLLTGNTPDYYDGRHMINNFANAGRGVTAQDIESWIRADGKSAFKNGLAKFASVGYQAIMSGLDSSLNGILLGGIGGASLPTAVMSLGAGVNQGRELWEKGASSREIAIGSIGSAAIEFLTEKIGMDRFVENFLDKPITSWKDFFVKAGIQGIAEGGEEVMSDIGNLVLDALNRGASSDLNQSIADYEQMGLSARDAKKSAWRDAAVDAFWSFYGGAVSGGAMAAGGGFNNALQTARDYSGMDNASIAALTQESREIQGGSKLADKVDARMAAGKSVNPLNLAALAQQNEQTLTQQDTAKITEAVKNRLTQLGETGNVSKVAAAIAKEAAGESLSRSERRAIRESTYAERVRNELNPDNIRNAYTASDWATQIGTQRVNAEEYGRNHIEEAPAQTAETAPQPEVAPESSSNTAPEGAEELLNQMNQEADIDYEYTEEREDSVPEGVQRDDLQSAGEQGGAVPGGAEAAGIREDQSRAEGGDRAEQAGAESQRVPGFEQQERIRLVNAESNPELTQIREQNAADGLNTIFFAGGNLGVTTAAGNQITVRGMISNGGKDIYVRTDHPGYTAAQINAHERTHGDIQSGRISAAAVAEQLRASVGNEVYDSAADTYSSLYAGLDMDPDELLEDMICDGVAGMNAWGRVSAEAGETGEFMGGFLEMVGQTARESRKESDGNRDTSGSGYDGDHYQQDIGESYSRETMADNLAAQNKALKKQLDYWKKQGTRTEHRKARPDDVRKAANALAKSYSTKMDSSAIRQRLQSIADMAMNTGNGNSFQEIQKAAEALAKDMISESSVLANDGALDTWKDIRKALMGMRLTISDTDKSGIADFDTWRKRYSRQIFWAKDGNGTPVDVAWLNLQDQFGPGFFPEDIQNPTDQLLHIADLLDRMGPIYENPFQGRMELAVKQCANDIINTIHSESVRAEAPTQKDLFDRQLQNEIVRGRQNVADAVNRERLRREKAVQRVKEEYAARDEARRERQQETDLRHQILKLRDQAKRMIVSPGKGVTQHASPAFVRSIVDMLDVFSQSEIHRLDRRAAHISEVQQQLDAENDPDEVIRLQNQQKRIVQQTSNMRQMIAEYKKFRNESPFFVADSKGNKETDVAEQMVLQMAEALENRDIYQLNVDELTLVRDAMKALLYSVENANRDRFLLTQNDRYENGKQFMQEMMDATGHKQGMNAKLGQFLQKQLTPDVFFDRVCGYKTGSIGQQIADGAKRGTERMLKVEQDFYLHTKPLTQQLEGTEKAEFDRMLSNPMSKDNLRKFGLTTLDGQEVEMPRQMMLQVYMLLQQKQSFKSLCLGGLKVPDFKAYFKGQVKNAYGEKDHNVLYTSEIKQEYFDCWKQVQKLQELLRLKQGDEGYRPYAEVQAEIDALQNRANAIYGNREAEMHGILRNIEKQISPLDRKILQTARSWYDHTGDLINEVYNSMWGIYRPMVKNYCPIHRDTDFVNIDMRSIQQTFNLENSSFTIQRTQSVGPILLTDLWSEMQGHTKHVARYYGFTEFQNDFNVLYNMRLSSWNTSIKGMIGGKFGEGLGLAKGHLGATGQQYVDNLIMDVSGTPRGGDDFLSPLYGVTAAATLTANPKVAISQLASIPTAAGVVGFRNMAAGVRRGSKLAFSTEEKTKLAEKNPWFFTRYRGEGSIREIADIQSAGGILGKIRDSKLGRATLNWCTDMDTLATSMMMGMAEEYVEQNGMKPGEEGYQQAVEDAYADILRHSQPNYTTTERSDLLRDSAGGMKLLTMFKTQSNMNFNMLVQANGRYQKARSDYAKQRNDVTAEDVAAAKQNLTNAITAQIAGNFSFVLLRAAVTLATGFGINAFRDDDKELTASSTMEAIAKEAISSAAGMVMLGGEIYSAVEAVVTGGTYYGLDDAALGALGDTAASVVQLAQRAVDEDKDIRWADVDKALGASLTLLGIPYGNAKKWINMARSYIGDAKEGTFGQWEYGVDRSNKQNTNRLLTAHLAGDTEKVGAVLAQMTANSSQMSTVTTAIRDGAKRWYTDGLLDQKQAVQILTEYADKDKDEAKQLVDNWQFMAEYPALYQQTYNACKKPAEKKDAVAYIRSLGLSASMQRALWNAVKTSRNWGDKDTPWR